MPPPSRRITLKELATRLDISTATVSNAFNRPDQLSTALRDRILREAKTLGYSGPDATARSLRTGRSRIVAVVLAESLTYSLNDAVASELLSGIAEVLDAHGRTLLLVSGRQHANRIPDSASMADGFIIYGLLPNRKMLADLPSRRPFVAIDYDLEGCPTVHVNNEQASYAIACHALAHLPQRPAVISLRLTKHPCNGRISAEQELLAASQTITHCRLQGFQRAFERYAIDPASVPMWNIEENTFAVCMPVIAEILDLPEGQRPTLLLCMSDRIALTALTLAEQRGLRVPDDLCITGFDGIAEGQYRAPRLTTVRQDSLAKGRLAASMILGKEPMTTTWLETELILGATCPPSA